VNEKILERLAYCIERGKAERHSKFPKDLANMEGAGELTHRALKSGLTANDILNLGLLKGMEKVGRKFKDGEYFIPDVLLASGAMKKAMEVLKPYFQSGEIAYKGRILIGTVKGDLHDIGKNLVAMVLEGGGWEVIDLGVDTDKSKFLESISKNKAQIVGLSALLTSTMLNMSEITESIKSEFPDIRVIVGGAPLSKRFAEEIGADAYLPDPQETLDYIDSISIN
jgi:5-methyltetrahydrofolate--homocysteine methyltransferase